MIGFSQTATSTPITPIAGLPGAANTQQALEQLAAASAGTAGRIWAWRTAAAPTTAVVGEHIEMTGVGPVTLPAAAGMTNGDTVSIGNSLAGPLAVSADAPITGGVVGGQLQTSETAVLMFWGGSWRCINMGFRNMSATGAQVVNAANAAAVRTAAGLGTISTQDANAVAITGGTISGVAGVGNGWADVVPKSADYTVQANDSGKLFVLDGGSGAAITMTFAAGSGFTDGAKIGFKRSAGTTVPLFAKTGGDTLEALASFNLGDEVSYTWDAGATSWILAG